jgi:hypothetical protein
VLLAGVVLAGCAPAPAPKETAKADPTTEAWYGPAVDQLAKLASDAKTLYRARQNDEAAALITKGQPLIERVLSAPRPTIAAMEAASDLDELYGRMLLDNQNYGWARLLFQKDAARWKSWQPQTPESQRRRKLAESEMAECDRHLGQ